MRSLRASIVACRARDCAGTVVLGFLSSAPDQNLWPSRSLILLVTWPHGAAPYMMACMARSMASAPLGRCRSKQRPVWPPGMLCRPLLCAAATSSKNSSMTMTIRRPVTDRHGACARDRVSHVCVGTMCCASRIHQVYLLCGPREQENTRAGLYGTRWRSARKPLACRGHPL